MTATLSHEVGRMSLAEKLELIDSLWASLSPSVDSLPVPDSHRVELKRREERLKNGEATFSDWDDAKQRIFKKAGQ